MQLKDIDKDCKPTVQTGLTGKAREINRSNVSVYSDRVNISLWGEEGSPTFVSLNKEDAEQIARQILCL